MSIQTGITDQCLERIATGTYNFSTDVFKIALYTSSASLGPTTTTYSSTNELSGGGYTSGGYTLTNVTPVVSERTLRITWQDVTTGALTQSNIRGAVIYNTTVSDEVVFVVDFGRVVTRTAETMTVKFLSTGTILFRG